MGIGRGVPLALAFLAGSAVSARVRSAGRGKPKETRARLGGWVWESPVGAPSEPPKKPSFAGKKQVEAEAAEHLPRPWLTAQDWLSPTVSRARPEYSLRRPKTPPAPYDWADPRHQLEADA
jgi:hypothetical protein